MQISGFLALIGSIIVSRFINEKGYRLLDDNQKVRLMDGFSRTRTYSMIPLFLLIIVYWLLATRTAIDQRILEFSYFALLIIYVIAQVIWNQQMLKRLELPANYRRIFSISQIVSLLGVAWFLFTMAYDLR